jgi:hypothetical protein
MLIKKVSITLNEEAQKIKDIHETANNIPAS